MPLHIFDVGDDLAFRFHNRKGAKTNRQFLQELLDAKPQIIKEPIKIPVTADPLLQENKTLIDALEDLKKENAKLKKKLKKVIDDD